jgi:nucleoside-diphosphate-sugar epimerase
MNSRVIVTGASGFVGKELLRELAGDYEVLAISRSFKHRQASSTITYIPADLADMSPDSLLAFLPGGNADFLIHAAGQVHTEQSKENKALFVRNNVHATENTLRLGLLASIKKFIYISSVAVYNDNPNDSYEQTKRAAESLVIHTCKEHGIAYVIIRPVIIYGLHGPSGYIESTLAQMKKGYYLLPNSGQKPQYLVYVRNLAFIVRNILLSDKYDDTIIVARDQDVFAQMELADSIREISNLPCKFVTIPTSIVKIMIIVINLFKGLGLFKGLQVRSVRKLNTKVEYPMSPLNEELITRLPYRLEEGLKKTVSDIMQDK